MLQKFSADWPSGKSHSVISITTLQLSIVMYYRVVLSSIRRIRLQLEQSPIVFHSYNYSPDTDCPAIFSSSSTLLFAYPL